jgi:hypothetical protein
MFLNALEQVGMAATRSLRAMRGNPLALDFQSDMDMLKPLKCATAKHGGCRS